MGYLANKLRSLIRWALVTADGDGDLDFPIQKLTYLGKSAEAVTWFPYGYHANMPANTLGLMLSAQGLPEGRVMFGGSPSARPSISSGEVAVYHPETGSILHMKDGGDIDLLARENGEILIETGGDLTTRGLGDALHIGWDLYLFGWVSMEIASGGAITITAPTLDANVTNTDFSGNVTINGTLTVNGEDYMDHTHGGSASAPLGGVTDTQGVN